MNGLVESFAATATTVCGLHITAGLVGHRVSIACAETLGYVSASRITAKQKYLLQENLNQILLQNPDTRYVVIGDHNHCDMRLGAFLADQQTLDMLAKHGIKQIFVEYPPKQQDSFDSVASKKTSSIDRKTHSTAGDKIGRLQDHMMVNLIQNAQDAEIKVYAADINNNRVTTALGFNMFATMFESVLLDMMGIKKFSDWWSIELGIKPFLANRFDDRSTAAFIKSHSKNERSLIFYGSEHVVNGEKNGLISNLPSSPSPLVFVFDDPAEKSYRSLQQTADEMSKPFIPPHYTINLETYRIQPYAQQPPKAQAGRSLSPTPG